MSLDDFCAHISRFWSLLYADVRREYGLDLLAELEGGIGWWEFASLVTGLSDESRFRYAVRRCPRRVSSPEDIRRITGNYLGPGGGEHSDPAPDTPEYAARPPAGKTRVRRR